tara:strand:- start:1321 stop:2280 length:960 start_codon:yes stop_codon:yes gene_type:complete
MATIHGSLSFYVEPDYVATGYVEGEPVDFTGSVTATGSRIRTSGSVVSITTSNVGTGQRTFGLDNIVYSWDETGTTTYNWDNWWLVDQTWEQPGIIFRSTSSVDSNGGFVELGNADLTFDSSVTSTGVRNLAGTISLDSVLTNSFSGGILFDAEGTITGQASVVALGGFLTTGNATINVTSVVTTGGVTTLTGNVNLTGIVQVTPNGTVDYIGNVTIPASTTITTVGDVNIKGNATINLGTVVVVIGSATPVADPFRTTTIDSETRKFPVLQETRSTTIQSETRVIIVPTETRNFTVESETRTFKIPIPPFVSTNIRKK